MTFPHLPPHPKSTPFPYTTLFRSLHAVAAGNQQCRERRRRAELARQHLGARRGAHRPRLRRDHPERRDRKSTRLNSSHGYISYAVFCLKKKKVLPRVLRVAVGPLP